MDESPVIERQKPEPDKRLCELFALLAGNLDRLIRHGREEQDCGIDE